ncbi:MAG: hypothetical protein H3C51_09490 [Rubellimicrobium sp.]|nr:hypothetical protein [Rubellimicrobium sp.]
MTYVKIYLTVCLPASKHAMRASRRYAYNNTPFTLDDESEQPDLPMSHVYAANPVTLVIGAVPSRFITPPYHLAGPDDIGWVLLARLAPGMVVSPLSQTSVNAVDAVDLAIRLAAFGYRGRYRAVSPALPCPDLVRCEVAQHAPGLDFDLWMLDEDAPPSTGPAYPGTATSPARKRAALAR